MVKYIYQYRFLFKFNIKESEKTKRNNQCSLQFFIAEMITIRMKIDSMLAQLKILVDEQPNIEVH